MEQETKELQVMSAKASIKVANRFLLWIPILQIIVYLFLPEMFSDTISLVGFIAIPLLYVHLKWRGSLRQVFKLNPVKLKAFIPLTIIALAIQPISTLLLMISTSIFGDHMTFIFKDLYDKPSLILFFTLCIVPALGEEFFLRGIVLHLYKPLRWPAQVIVNGFLFGVFHQNLNQFSYSLFIGMVLALAVIVTKSIWSGIWIHFLNNFLCFLESELDFSLMNSSIDSPTNWSVTFLLAALSIWVLFKLFTWVNAYYSNESLVETLDAEDQVWVEANQCEKLRWNAMFTVSMWALLAVFALMSTVIILSAKGIIN